MLHTYMVYTRYQRAVTVLVLLPKLAYDEIARPTLLHELGLAIVFGMIPLAGWAHRLAAQWWAAGPTPRRRGPTPPPPILGTRPGGEVVWQDPNKLFAEFRRYDSTGASARR